MAEDGTKTLHVRNGKLWPSTLYIGATVVRFLTGNRGRSIKVEHRGRGKPRHKSLAKRKKAG